MKAFSFILLSTFFAILLAQDCNNPLLSTFNLTGLDAPQTVSGLVFCDNLQSGQTCCSAETVQGFQDRLDNLTTSLQNLGGQRDVYLTELYANYSDQFQSAADDLTDYSDEIDRLQRDNATIGDEVRAQYNVINRIANALDNIDDHFKSSVREYQQRRSACFNTVLQVQSSAWCLACDPNYSNLGVQSDGSVNSSPEVCNAIQSSCALYTERADYFNPLWQAQQAYQQLVNLTRYLRDYKNNNYVIPENVTLENDIFVPTNDTETTSALPENCTQDSCQWQCENFFSPNLVLNESIVSNGGGILGDDDINFPPVGSNMPPVVNNPNDTVNEVTETVDSATGAGRLLQELQESLWAPNLDGTGLNFNVVDDPADVAAIWNNNPAFDDSDTNNPTDTENTETDNDDDFTDNDGVNTTENDDTDNDGFDTTNNTDNDGFDTTGNNDNTQNDETDNDGFDTTNNTDNDGIDTTGDDTNNDNTNDDDTNPTNPTNNDDNDDDTDGN